MCVGAYLQSQHRGRGILWVPGQPALQYHIPGQLGIVRLYLKQKVEKETLHSSSALASIVLQFLKMSNCTANNLYNMLNDSMYYFPPTVTL